MDEEFFGNCFQQLFLLEANKLVKSDPLKDYSSVLVNFVKGVYATFKNNPTTNKFLYQYLLKNAFNSEFDFDWTPTHFYLRELKLEEDHVINYTQIVVRIVLLAIACRQGEEKKRKQWKKYLDKYFFEAHLSLSFNSMVSLAELLVIFLEQVSEIFQEFTFYEQLNNLCQKYDLSFTQNWVIAKLKQLKKNWNKEQLQKKSNWTTYSKKYRKKQQNSKIQKVQTPTELKEEEGGENSAKERIKHFYTSNKKKTSVPLQPRTIHQRRTSFIKSIDYQLEDEQQIEYFEPSQQKGRKKSENKEKGEMKSRKKKEKSQETDDCILAQRTP